jgi:hypothetical protein
MTNSAAGNDAALAQQLLIWEIGGELRTRSASTLCSSILTLSRGTHVAVARAILMMSQQSA